LTRPTPIEVFKAIQKDHPTAAGLIPDTKKNLEAIRQFLIDHKIVLMPSEVRAIVMETPQFARATSFASMDTPGAFETKATEAYYYVTRRKLIGLHNRLKNGDCFQLLYHRYCFHSRSLSRPLYPVPASKCLKRHPTGKDLRKLRFYRRLAHYTEQMLLDEGFGVSEDKLKAIKYRIAQSDEALLRLCRLCVSIMIHTQNMTVEAATKFFMDNCYYERKPLPRKQFAELLTPAISITVLVNCNF